MEEKELSARNEAQKMVTQLSKFLEPMELDHKYFIESVQYEHQNAQQRMFGLFLSCIKAWADMPDGHFDFRNEHAVKTSRLMIAALGDVEFVNEASTYLNALNEKIATLEAKAVALEATLEKFLVENTSLKKANEELAAELKDSEQATRTLLAQELGTQSHNKDLKRIIINLKAKLYDCLYNENLPPKGV